MNLDIAAIVAKIDPFVFEEAYDAGRVMTLEKAVVFALEKAQEIKMNAAEHALSATFVEGKGLHRVPYL